MNPEMKLHKNERAGSKNRYEGNVLADRALKEMRKITFTVE